MEVVVMTTKPQIVVERKIFTDKSTIGNLSLLGNPFCFTLEDTVRRQKVMDNTCIPSGKYRVLFDISSRFGYSPILVDVPFFAGIRIHWGNSDSDTSGCFLVGRKHSVDFVSESKAAFQLLMDELIPLKKTQDIWLEVAGGLSKDEMFGLES